MVPAAAIALWTFIAVAYDRFSLIALLLVTEYFLIPALLLKLSRKEFLKYGDRQKLQLTDALAILAIWLPFELGIVKPAWRLDARIAGEEFGYLLNVLVSFVYALVLFRAYRGIDIGFRWRLGVTDFRILLIFFLALTGILATVTLTTGLTRFGISETRIWFISILLFGGFFNPALSEEFIFRGLLQHGLVKRFGVVTGIVAASMMFGLAHINNNEFGFAYPNWPFVGLASIAGLGYGLIYHKRKSLALAAGLHLAVDFTHWIFFGGK